MARTSSANRIAVAAVWSWAALVPCSIPDASAQDTSSAESRVSIERAEYVRITKIDDILIGAFPANATIDARTYRTDQFDYQCVQSSTGSFGLTVSSANGNGRLRLASDAGDRMTYELHLWFRRVGGSFRYTSTRYPVSPVTLTGLSGSTSPTCADEGLGNHNFIVTGVVQRGAFNDTPPGIYRDTITLTVTPE